MKFKYKHIDKGEWHEAFAWLPTKVSDNYPEQNTVVWGEKIMRKQSWDGKSWDRYSKKVYFKKKLNGDFDKSEGIMRAEDSVSSAGQVSSPVSNLQHAQQVAVSRGYIDTDIKIYDENGKLI